MKEREIKRERKIQTRRQGDKESERKGDIKRGKDTDKETKKVKEREI